MLFGVGMRVTMPREEEVRLGISKINAACLPRLSLVRVRVCSGCLRGAWLVCVCVRRACVAPRLSHGGEGGDASIRLASWDPVLPSHRHRHRHLITHSHSRRGLYSLPLPPFVARIVSLPSPCPTRTTLASLAMMSLPTRMAALQLRNSAGRVISAPYPASALASNATSRSVLLASTLASQSSLLRGYATAAQTAKKSVTAEAKKAKAAALKEKEKLKLAAQKEKDRLKAIAQKEKEKLKLAAEKEKLAKRKQLEKEKAQALKDKNKQLKPWEALDDQGKKREWNIGRLFFLAKTSAPRRQ